VAPTSPPAPSGPRDRHRRALGPDGHPGSGQHDCGRGSTRTSPSRKQSNVLGNPRRNARKRIPPATRRRALELLASCRDGCTEAIMSAHGFSIDMLVELINTGLASASTERVVAGTVR
jgi:hypothetical protein